MTIFLPPTRTWEMDCLPGKDKLLQVFVVLHVYKCPGGDSCQIIYSQFGTFSHLPAVIVVMNESQLM